MFCSKCGNTIGMEFVLIEPGKFLMGSPDEEAQRDADEVRHRVRLTKRFLMAATEVTQAQWQKVMPDNPSNFRAADLPVERVSWNDAMEFCRKLNEQEAKRYRLPTEAEWEYACRAGTTGPYAGNLERMAWYTQNTGGTTHPVATKQANAWGLHDMHGNVAEWCADWYGDYPAGSVAEPPRPANGSSRVLRGGSWFGLTGGTRSAARGWNERDRPLASVGFRPCADI